MPYPRTARWMLVTLLLIALGTVGLALHSGTASLESTLRRLYLRAVGVGSAHLRLTVRDARSMAGIPGATCVIGETGDRLVTDAQGAAPERITPAESGLSLLCYKQGYEDAGQFGIRMHAGQVTETEVLMHPVTEGEGDERGRVLGRDPAHFGPGIPQRIFRSR